MIKRRVALLVYIDLDPVPGAFHTPDSALNNTRGILEEMVPHYNPAVQHAPDFLQPINNEGTND